jgi:hypothetical protein
MREYNLDFCFKGARTYVQGPDIFDTAMQYLLAIYPNIKNIKYSAHELLYANATLEIVEKVKKSEFSIINSIISFMVGNKKYFGVISSNNKPIECRIDYSEKVVEEHSNITSNIIEFKNTLDYSFTEIVVSMNKWYLNNTIKESGKWIVTKFDYINLSEIQNTKGKNIKVELVQNLNNKLTKSVLSIENKIVGNLYFSQIQKEI